MNQWVIGRMLILVAISIIFYSCKTEEGCGNEPIQSLMGCWWHSYEEDISNDILIFRPCNDQDQEIPLSRFRSVYVLKDEGSCEYLVLHPLDAHYMEEGKWDYNACTGIIQVKTLKDSSIFEMEVMDLEEDKLTVKQGG